MDKLPRVRLSGDVSGDYVVIKQRAGGVLQVASPKGGRPRVDDRVCFNAIVFVLFTGIAWRHLPREMGCSPATAHRRLTAWQEAGVFERLHRMLLEALNGAGRIDWATAVIDGSHIRVLQGGLDRPLPGRPCAHRLKAPPDHRLRRGAAGDLPDGRQPQRRHPVAAAGRRDRPGPREGGTTAQALGPPARRPRL